MKFCPYCGSAHLIHLDQIAGVQSSIPSALSSTLITTVCTQLAKHARISPVVGSVLGMVISGVAVVIQEQWSNKKLPHRVAMLLCQDCQQSFQCPTSTTTY